MFRYFEWLIPALPAFGALLNSLPGTWLTRRARNWIAGGALVGSLLFVLPILSGQIIQPGLVGRSVQLPWSNIGTLSQLLPLSFSILIDPITTVLMLTILICVLVIWADVNHIYPEAALHRQALILLGGTAAALLALAMADNLMFLSISWALAGWGIYALAAVGEPTETRHSLSLARHLLADLALLLAVGAMIPLVGSALSTTIPATPGTVAAGIFLLVAAVARSTLLFSCAVAQTTTHTALHVLSVAPAIYLVARIDSLLGQAPLLPPLLIGWGVLSALALAAAALYEPQDAHSPARLALAQGGLLLSGLGVGAYTAVLAFLPAYALIHLSLRPAGSEAEHRTSWTRWVGPAALAGLPLLPGLTWHAQLFRAAGNIHWAVLAVLVLAVLVLAAAAGRAAHGPRTQPASGVSWTLSAALLALGLASMLAPPALSRFLTPVPADSALRPAWPWYVLSILTAGLGAAAGYLYRLPKQRVPGDDWPGRIQTDHPQPRLRLFQTIGQSLAQTTAWLAESAEPWLGRHTFGLLARFLYARAETGGPDESTRQEGSR